MSLEDTTVGDVIDRMIGGGTPAKNNPEFWNGTIPWASVKDFSNQEYFLESTQDQISKAGLDSSAANLIPAGIPIIVTRMAVGRCLVTSCEMAINQDLKALFPKPNSITAGYLARSIQFREHALAAQGIGSTVKGIAVKVVKSLQIFCPSLAEQYKICEILEVLDTAIEKTEALIAKYEQIKKGIMQDLFTRGLDEAGRLRPPPGEAPDLYHETELGLLPKGWIALPISAFAENLDGRRIPLKQDDRDSRSGIFPYYGASGIIDWIDDYIFDGDYVLLGEDGANVVTRVVPLAIRAAGKFWVNNHAHIFSPHDDVNIDFLVNLLEHTDYSSIVLGSAQPKITQNGLDKLKFPKPDSGEQDAIALRINAIDNKINGESSSLNKLRAQKAGLMQDLLTGKVRVKSDTSDTEQPEAAA